jgi:urease accessory protein
MAMLGTWSRMGEPEATDYRALVRSGLAFGHLPIVHGLVYAGAGLDLPTAETAACWTTASALANAAIRIGATGPLAAQGALAELRDEFAAMLDEPVDIEHPPSAWTPVQDIAQARHTLADLRLFAS